MLFTDTWYVCVYIVYVAMYIYVCVCMCMVPLKGNVSIACLFFPKINLNYSLFFSCTKSTTTVKA